MERSLAGWWERVRHNWTCTHNNYTWSKRFLYKKRTSSHTLGSWKLNVNRQVGGDLWLLPVQHPHSVHPTASDLLCLLQTQAWWNYWDTSTLLARAASLATTGPARHYFPVEWPKTPRSSRGLFYQNWGLLDMISLVLMPESPKLLRVLSFPGWVLFPWLLLWDQFQGECVGVAAVPTPAGYPVVHPVLTLSTRGQHQISEVKDSVPQDGPNLGHLCLYGLPTDCRFQWHPSSLRLIHLLEPLMESRETFYS